jgi:hypothetical protein
MTGHGVEDFDRVAALRSVDSDISSRQLTPDLEAVLRPFLDQSSAPDAIVAVGCDWLWKEGNNNRERASRPASKNEAMFLRLAVADDKRSLAIVARIPLLPAKRRLGPKHTFDSLARQASELANGGSGNHLLLLPGGVLKKMQMPAAGDFGFRALVTLPSRDLGRSGWKLQRTLFDHGLVGIAAAQVAGGDAHCFLASDAVSSPRRLGAVSRGTVTMTSLGRNGRFANQLFQYAFLKLYALRHGLTAAVPNWRGKDLYGFDDPSCAGLALPELSFVGHVSFERELWDVEEPPIDVDMQGYFQEIPACWRKHRPFLRRLFRLPLPLESAIGAWHADLTRCGQRTLVAIHVRRGDYRDVSADNMWFRLIPEEWYLAWLRTIWPTLRHPLLYVATDEPDVIPPIFKEFETVSATFSGAAQLLPDFLRDFEILRRADYLAICNSSFSRMAAILAHRTQKCFLPELQTKRFVPYEPWLDGDFWRRFSVK